MNCTDTTHLNNRCVLMVEDEGLIPMPVRDFLAHVGCRSMTAFNLIDALVRANKEQFDCALLDVSIGDQMILDVADAIARRNIPLVFTSGHRAEVLPDRYSGHALLLRPYMSSDLARAISGELQDHSRRSSEFSDEDSDPVGHAPEKAIAHANSNSPHGYP